MNGSYEIVESSIMTAEGATLLAWTEIRADGAEDDGFEAVRQARTTAGPVAVTVDGAWVYSTPGLRDEVGRAAEQAGAYYGE